MIFPISLFSKSWKDFDVKVLTEKLMEHDDSMYLILEDSNKQKFYLNFYDRLEEKNIKKIIDLKNKFYEMKQLTIKKILFTVDDNSIGILIIPKKFIYKGKDIKSLVPGGLSYYYINDKLQYDFRVIREDFSFKLSGDYDSDLNIGDAILNTKEKKKILIKKEIEDKKKLLNRKLLSQGKIKLKDLYRKELEKKGFKKKQKEPLKNYSFNIFAGSGATASIAFSFHWKKIEIMPFLSYNYYVNNDTKKSENQIPLGLRVAFHFFRGASFSTYLLTASSYQVGIGGSDNKIFWSAGIGQIFLKYLFFEIGVVNTTGESPIAAGFGVRLPF